MSSGSRVLLVTGKGGVGKTTVAAATAAHCATLGLRTLAVSTDAAHSLGDVWGVDVSSDGGPVPVAPHLWSHEIDTRQAFERAWADFRTEAGRWLDVTGLDGVRAGELAVVPGLDEVIALAELAGHLDDPRWDVVVIDCAPTAETVRLLSAPAVLRWWGERLGAVAPSGWTDLLPLAERMLGRTLPDPALLARGGELVDRLAHVATVLTDGERSTARLVTLAEPVVVDETRRTHTYLSLFGHRVDAVVVNRLLPADLDDPWFDRWRALQADELARVRESFPGLAVIESELRDHPPIGADELAALGAALHGDDDPTGTLSGAAPWSSGQDDEGAWLRLELPGAPSGAVEVGRRREELFVAVGPYRRAVLLPDSLADRRLRSASLSEGRLTVRFDRAPATGGTST